MGPETGSDGHAASPAAAPAPVSRDPAGAQPSRPRLRGFAAALRGQEGPEAVVVRRAVRVTVAAGIGFYVCLYGLDAPVAAVYALFASVAMGVLSRIPGTGRRRAGIVLRLLPAAWFLVIMGTVLAVRTWAAVAGMLVVGFVLAYGAVAGPRPAGAAPGLQLLYILPCFPPYAPGTLDERLAGVTLGLLLLVAAEAFVMPDKPGPDYRELLARASEVAARCARELAGSPAPLPADLRAQAHAASEALRPSHAPEADRPAGPGIRDRALAHAGAAARQLLLCLQELPAGPARGSAPEVGGPDVLRQLGVSADRSAAALRGGAAPEISPLEREAEEFRRTRASLDRPGPGGTTVPLMLRQAAETEAAEMGLTLLRAVRVALGDRTVPRELRDGPFWYVPLSEPRLWWRRFTGHLGPRSVYFQNAVRLSIGLAAARAVAGVTDLPHGFWVMLAALTLTRTTAALTGSTVRRALTGTLLGALAAAGILVLAGRHTDAYAAVLPVIMLVAFCLGPVLGVGWAQGLFTLVVSMAFAQLAPATWQLAEVRFLDVLTGSLIGLACGVVAWPRGAHHELRRSTGALLREVASMVTDTTSALADGQRGLAPGDHRALLHALVLAESSFVQAQSEPPDPRAAGVDWQAALIAGHHALHGSGRLLREPAAPGELGPRSRAWLTLRAEAVAERCLLLGRQLERSGPDGVDGSCTAPLPLAPWPAEGPVGTPPALLPLVFDTAGWLRSVAVDLRRVVPPSGS